MRFYCISKTDNFIYKTAGETVDKTIGALKKACESHEIEFNLVDSNRFDSANFPKLTQEGIVYRVTMDASAVRIENEIVNEKCRTFYKDPVKKFPLYDGFEILEKAGLPVIETVHEIVADYDTLKRHSEELGGFPVVIKCLGKTHGIGVMKIDSLESLVSVVDYLKTLEAEGKKFVLKKYFEHSRQGRIIVLGDRVIASHENVRIPRDFRTNAVPEELRERRAVKYENALEEAAVKAVNSLNVNFGAVDILINEDGDFRIAEVNFPCYFNRTQEITGVDITGMMVEFLAH